MTVHAKIIERIIRHQEAIIGPVALEQAREVEDLVLNWDKHEVEIKGDGVKAIDHLVEKYEELFGQASIEVCKEAASPFLTNLEPNQIPNLLK